MMKAVAVLLLAFATVASCQPAGASMPPVSSLQDPQIVNLLLNIEYLEANYYQCAAFGYPIATNLSSGGPTPYGCRQANLTAAAQAFAETMAAQETAHIELLLGFVGSQAVPQKQIDFDTGFAIAGHAAFGDNSPMFDPFVNDLAFYLGAFFFEEVGLTLYYGTLMPALGMNPLYSFVHAGIQSTEAAHAQIVRSLLYGQRDTMVQSLNQTVGDATDQLAEVINLVEPAGANSFSEGLQAPALYPASLPVDMNGVPYQRMPQDVLSVLYLGGMNNGAFFPNGVAGVYGSSASAMAPTPTAAASAGK